LPAAPAGLRAGGARAGDQPAGGRGGWGALVGGRPLASNLDFAPGETIPNLVVVPVGADGKIDLYNSLGTVNLIADLAGYYVN
jgi:hypothetical protein